MASTANPLVTSPDDQAIQASIDQYTQQQLAQQNSRLQANIAAASQKNPDMTAEAQRLGLQVGVGADIAGRNMDTVRKMAAVQHVGNMNLPETAPKLAKMLEDPNFSGIAYDDIGNLSRIEQGGAQLSAYTPTWRDKVTNAAQTAFEAMGGTGNLKQKLFQDPILRLGFGALQGTESFGGNVGSFFGWHGSNPQQLNPLQMAAKSLEPESFDTPRTELDTVAQFAGPMLPTLGTAGGVSALARMAGLSENAVKVASALGVGGLFSSEQGGATYSQMIAAGKTDDEARHAANLVGALNLVPNTAMGLTDFVPFLKRNPWLSSVAMGAVTGATGQVAQNWVTGQPLGTNVAQGAIQSAVAMGGMHLGFAGFEPTVSDMIDAAANSKLRGRSPEAFQQAMDTQFEGDPSFRIPATDFVNYFQSKNLDPALIANHLGVTNLAEATAAGTDLEVPKPNFFARLDEEHARALLPDLIDPATDLSARQTEAGSAEIAQFVQSGGFEKLRQEFAQADAEIQATPEWQSVHDQLKQRYMDDAGEAEPVAEQYATLHANVYANLAQRAGLKPDELLAMHNARIVAGDEPGAALYQSGVPIGGQEGKETTLLTPTRQIPAKYRLVEADDLQPSHNAQTFAKNPEYPEGLQERAYDTSKEAQARVIQQAQNYDPRYTVNTNPDAVNGPPVVTPDGTVLGGNLRAISTQRLYEKDGSAYKNALKAQASAYGFTPEQVDAMQKPVLVRQIESPATADDARRIGSELNKSMTGSMSVSERAVSAGKNIKPETLRSVADMMQTDDSTLREAMGRHGAEFVKMLTADGVITERERPQFVDAATGGLNEEGKTFVERALLGSVIDDPRLMDAAPKAVLGKLERSLGSITSFASRADEWNLLPVIRDAVSELGSIQREGSTVALRLGQTSLFGGERNPLVDAMVKVLDGKPNAVREAFEKFARDSDENMPGQARMFGEANAFDAFNHAFGGKLSWKEYRDGLKEASTNIPNTPASGTGSDAAHDESLPGSAGGDSAPGGAGGGESDAGGVAGATAGDRSGATGESNAAGDVADKKSPEAIARRLVHYGESFWDKTGDAFATNANIESALKDAGLPSGKKSMEFKAVKAEIDRISQERAQRKESIRTSSQEYLEAEREARESYGDDWEELSDDKQKQAIEENYERVLQEKADEASRIERDKQADEEIGRRIAYMDKKQDSVEDLLKISGVDYSVKGSSVYSRYLNVELPDDEFATIRVSDHEPPIGRGGMKEGGIDYYDAADISLHPGDDSIEKVREFLAEKGVKAADRSETTGESNAADDVGKQGPSKRGWFRVLGPGRYEIGKTSIGDLSTFIHEPAHQYLEIFRDLTQREGASEPLKDDFKKICDWLGTTPEDAQRDGFTRAQHEKWAEANEKYVSEGKAPTSGLTRAFHNFAVWLGSIYRRAGALGVELSPEIRGVMDRLYAGETAIDRAEMESPQRLFNSPEEGGWTEEQYQKYADSKGLEVNEAKAQVWRELKDAELREKTQSWKEEKANVREAVTQEIDAKPEYAAIRSLRRGHLDGDEDAKIALNREELVKQFGEDRVKALQKLHRGLYRTEGGTDAETASELLGYHSGEEMMQALENAPRREAAIKAATDAYMTAKHGDVRYDGSLPDVARLAMENDERAKSTHAELVAVRKQLADAREKLAGFKALIETAPLAEYREAARQMIQSKSIADLQPNRYLDASRRFSREAFEARGKGDIQRAAEAKNKELLNHFLFREAAKEQDYVKKLEAFGKTAQNRGPQQRLGLADESVRRETGTPGDFRDQFNWLANRYRFGPSANAPARSLRAWAEDLNDQGEEPAIAPGILNENRFADYRNIPMSEVHDMHDALLNIRHLALRRLNAEIAGKRVEYDSIAKELTEGIRANVPATPEKFFQHEQPFDAVRDALRSVDVQSSRMEFLMDKADGGERGPWKKYLWEPYQNAKGDEYAMQADWTKRINDQIETEAKRMGLHLFDKVAIDGIPAAESVTRKDLVSIAMNMGNEGNLDRLQKTFADRGFDPAALRDLGGKLSGDEWKFVQAVWDSLKPWGERMTEFEKRMTGLPPQMVEIKPFKVVTNDGVELDLDGGYFPIKQDPRYSDKGAQEDASKTAQNMMEKGYGRATMSRSYTKERTGYGGPLLLDYERVLTDHIAKVTKDLSHREFMLTSNRILTRPDVRQSLRETLGPGYDQEALAWLRATVNDRNGSVDGGANDMRFMEKIRSNLVKASLAFKGSTALLQFTHLSRLALFTKPANFTQSMVDFWKDPAGMTQNIRDLSPNVMRFRGDHLDRDYASTLAELSGRKDFRANALRFGYAAMKYVDHAISFPLWHSVYNETLLKNGPEMAEDESHKVAMHAADAAVRMGLGDSAAGDLPPLMRSRDMLKKIESTLFGFENLNYNIMRHKVGDDVARQWRAGSRLGAAGKLTYGAAMALFVPAILSAYVRGDGPKDGESWGAWAAKRSLFFAGATIPWVKDAASLYEHGSLNPMASFVERNVKELPKEAAAGEWTDFGIDSLSTIGDLFGIPGTAQATHTAHYLHRVQEGKIANPTIYGAIVGGH